MNAGDDPRAILTRFYEAESAYLAVDEGDFAPMADTLHPECVMVQPESLPYAGEWRGHEGYHRWMLAFGRAWASLSVEDSSVYVADGETVISRSIVVATARLTGQEIKYPLLQIITIREGRILRIEPFHWDTHQVLAALAGADPYVAFDRSLT